MAVAPQTSQAASSSRARAAVTPPTATQVRQLSSVVFTGFLFLVSLYVWAAVLSFSVADWPGFLFGQYPDVLVSPAPDPTHNVCGRSGAWVSYQLFYYFGAGTYVLAAFLSVLVIARSTKGRVGQPWFRGVGTALMMTATAAAFAPGQPLDRMLEVMSTASTHANRLLVGNGGVLGQWVALNLDQHFGTYGWLILAATFAVGMVLALDDVLARTPTAARWVKGQAGQVMAAVQAHRPEPAPMAAVVAMGAGTAALATSPASAGLLRRLGTWFRGRLPAVRAGVATERVDRRPEPQAEIEPAKPSRRSSAKPEAPEADDAPAEALDAREPASRRKTKTDKAEPEAESPADDVAEAVEAAVQDEEAEASPVRPARTRKSRSKGAIAPPMMDADLASEVPAEPAADADDEPAEAGSAAAPVEREPEPAVEADAAEAEAKAAPEPPAAPPKAEIEPEKAPEPAAPPVERPKVRPELIVRIPARRPKPVPELVRTDLGDYELPSQNLLENPDGSYSESQKSAVEQKGRILQEALATFRIDARVVNADIGPVITTFEVEPAPGVKVAQISGLQNDIARAMRAPTIRIVAPIPGKNTVGIEVPNANKEKVRLKELFEMMPDAAAAMPIPLYLGKDASGNALVSDLSKWPHGIIAGGTGSGKSVCINTIIMSILMTQRPDVVKLILVDPKVVEMGIYKDVPHLLSPIITDMGKAAGVLDWACSKMEERYAMFAEAGVRDIRGYNKLGPDKIKELFKPDSPEDEAKIPVKLPYIVIIVDEFADLMLTNGKEIEQFVARLAAKARAAGIHLILATQRPDANVVTGLIKSNMQTRIAFRVAGRTNSRIVLDQNGAELLLGQGDMLMLPPGGNKLLRAQGTYIEDSETHAVLEYLKTKAKPEFSPELMGLKDPSAMDNLGERDELFDQAVRVVLESKRGSVSLIQRKFGIGYSRASRIIEQMAEAGILGSHKNAQAREVCMTVEEYEAICRQAKADADAGYAADQPDAEETAEQREARESRERQAAESADEPESDEVPDAFAGEERG